MSAVAATAAHAGQPFALELRGGPSVHSGHEAFRLQYLGDNDSLGWATNPETGLPFDRWYTMSTKLLIRWAVPRTRFSGADRLLVSASMGLNMYTPRTAYVATVAELNGDRPYSGWLSVSVGADWITRAAPLAFVRNDRAYSQLGAEVHAGAMGPWSFAGPIQHYAHNAYRYFQGQLMPPIIGWGLAETAPGLTADVSLYADTTLASVDWEPPRWMAWSGGRPGLQWIAGARGDLGTMLGSAAVTTMVIGGWLGDPVAPRPTRVPTALYLFVRGEGRVIGWNATIDQPVLSGDRVARSERWGFQAAVGAALRVWMLEVSYSQLYRSNEVSTLPSPLRTGQLLGQWSGTVVF